MKRFRRVVVPLLMAVAMLAAFAPAVGAANPTVTITMSAQVVSITNTQANWALGVVVVDQVIYFSATGSQDDDYSTITNTGNVGVNVAIQGTNFEGGSYDLTLAAAPGSEQYSLYATNQTVAPTYNIEVKTAAYANVCVNLPSSGADTCTWSMKFTAPSAYNANDDGAQKTSTVTLVATKYT